jgi:prepilin-type N-terminal cleavage/methylation domain-containing protein
MSSTHVLAGRFGKSTRGFTLVELLVVLLIVSILIAAIVPVVTRQAETADPVRVANDLQTIRDAIALFQANVGKTPGDLEDLVNVINPNNGTAADRDSTILAARYTAADSLVRWKGPYLNALMPDTGAASFALVAFKTGFGANVAMDLQCLDPAPGTVDTTANATALCATAVAGGQTRFVAVRIDSLGLAAFRAVNDIIDGTETSPTTTGRLRCTAPACALGDRVYYLAVPVGRQ